MINKSVLIVEDHPDVAKLLQRWFVDYGWKPEVADTLAAGIHRANTHPYPEIILLDLTLPDSTVEQTIGRLPEMMFHGPVVVHSNDDRPAVRQAIEAQGAIFLAKDFVDDGARRLSAAMVDAVSSWRGIDHNRKRAVTEVETSLLNLSALDLAIRTHG